MELKNLDLCNFIKDYKIGIENILKTRSVKALEDKFYILSNLLNIENIFDIDSMNKNEIEKLLNENKVIYLPFISGFDSYVICVSGSEFDLDEGMENDWIEGVGYIPSGSRIVDIGDFTVSYRNLVGIIMTKKDGIYKIEIGEYLKGGKVVRQITNTGLLGLEIKEFIEKFNR